MLDPCSPWAKAHFAIEEHFRKLAEAGYKMTAQPSCRLDTFKLVQPHFAALRLLNQQHCGNTTQASAAIDDFEKALEAIAHLDVTRDKPLYGVCPSCGRSLNDATRGRALSIAGTATPPLTRLPAALGCG